MLVIGVLFSLAAVVSAIFATQGRMSWAEYEVRTRVGEPELG